MKMKKKTGRSMTENWGAAGGKATLLKVAAMMVLMLALMLMLMLAFILPVTTTILFTNVLILREKKQGEVAVVKKTWIKVAFVVLVVLTLSMLHAPCTHFVEKLPSIALPSSRI